MKIQYLAVIFIIIILPITLITSYYIGTQIDTISLQTGYNAKLTDSTYDAVKAYQINTVNNRYSSISDSKIRDIEAAVNTFYTSLSDNKNLTKEELKSYVPALVFTLYDGYYIYSKYDNVYPDNPEDTEELQPILDEEELKKDKYTNYGLKPYIYYSCHYKNSTKDFVINYTLDNAITICGTFNEKYQTLSGYLINPNAVKIKDERNFILIYDADGITNDEDVLIGPELLTEHLLFADKSEKDYDYLVYNGQKIYYDTEKEQTATETKYFRYQNYSKSYITESHNNEELVAYLRKRTVNNRLYSTSSFEYYYNAKIFSEKIAELTKGITQNNAVDEQGNPIDFEIKTTDDIFVATTKNDPLLSGSTFNENRMAAIRKSIETNVAVAIANYNMYSGNNYEFSMPVLTEEDWAKMTNKVSILSFLQGIPIGHKYYNNYCVITNDNNEETINKENIYIITQNTETNEREYHLPGCTYLAQPQSKTNLRVTNTTNSNATAAYSNLSFLRQTVRISEGNYLYFYPQTRGTSKKLTTITGCYHCIVNADYTYSADEIIKGIIIGKDNNWQDYEQYNVSKAGDQNARIREIRSYYIKALARERYDLYQANISSFNSDY